MSNTRAGPVQCTPDPWLVHCGRVAENGSLSLRDGTPLSVRSLRPEDREVLRAGIERQSPDSQYTRFFTTFPHGVPRKVLDNLVDRVDGVNYIALLLLAPGDERIGVGRLVRDPHMPESAEISIAIDDAWQGKGAGTALGHALTRQARRQGIDFVTASVRIANNRALALLGSLGVVRSRQLAEPGVYATTSSRSSSRAPGTREMSQCRPTRPQELGQPRVRPKVRTRGRAGTRRGRRRRTGRRPGGPRRGSRGEDCQSPDRGQVTHGSPHFAPPPGEASRHRRCCEAPRADRPSAPGLAVAGVPGVTVPRRRYGVQLPERVSAAGAACRVVGLLDGVTAPVPFRVATRPWPRSSCGVDVEANARLPARLVLHWALSAGAAAGLLFASSRLLCRTIAVRQY